MLAWAWLELPWWLIVSNQNFPKIPSSHALFQDLQKLKGRMSVYFASIRTADSRLRVFESSRSRILYCGREQFGRSPSIPDLPLDVTNHNQAPGCALGKVRVPVRILRPKRRHRATIEFGPTRAGSCETFVAQQQ